MTDPTNQTKTTNWIMNINKEVLSSDFSLISKIASQKALIRKWTPGGVGDIKERENHFKVCSW